MSGRRPKRTTPVPIASRLDPKILLARYERLAVEYDRMCGKVMVEQAEVRRLSRASGRHLSRMIAAQHRAQVAEAALAAATSHPAQMARLLLQAETLLYRLSADACPSCGLVAPQHRHNCQVSRLLAAIVAAMPV